MAGGGCVSKSGVRVQGRPPRGEITYSADLKTEHTLARQRKRVCIRGDRLDEEAG